MFEDISRLCQFSHIVVYTNSFGTKKLYHYTFMSYNRTVYDVNSLGQNLSVNIFSPTVVYANNFCDRICLQVIHAFKSFRRTVPDINGFMFYECSIVLFYRTTKI